MIEKKKMNSTAVEQEKAILVAVSTQKQTTEQTEEYLNELEFLASTAGVEITRRFTQNLEKPDIRTYVGSGRLQDIHTYIIDNPVDMVIFDDDLSPAQVRNLEAVFKEDVKVLDRSLLILTIFAMRAQSAQARTQVELAQYQYMYPRLTRMWSHLSRQKAGVGSRGPGEKELETDRRIVKDRIAFLREKLEKIDRQSTTQRKERGRLVRVALVGYTNVGKSTLMRRVAKADVFAENKLFATVDSTVRKVAIENIPFLLSDTVGFIRKLPTTLIESFKSTLDEVREADILLHVVDISHPLFEEQIEVVNTTLADIGAADKPTILVYNKIDLYQQASEDNNWEEIDEGEEPLEEKITTEELIERLKRSYLSRKADHTVFISAEQKDNLDELRNLLFRLVKERHFMIYPNWVDMSFSDFNLDV